MKRRGVILAVCTTLALWESAGAFAQEPLAVQDRRADDQRPPAAQETVVNAPLGPSCIPTGCPPQDWNGTLLWGHPLLDPPPAQPGWFTALEVDVVRPTIVNQHVIGQVLLDGVASDVELPIATFAWTGAPRIEVGYRFPAAVGELAASYQLLASEGSATIVGFDGAGSGALKSRLDANVVFLDYTSREFSLWPRADMKAHVGVCVPSIFFDSQAVGALRSERISSYFCGAGPHLGFDFWQHLAIPGLDLYSRLEGAETEGFLRQRFDESLGAAGGPQVTGSSAIKMVREVPMIHLEVGVGYTAPWAGKQLRFFAGYTIEHWWYLAQTYNTPPGVEPSRGELAVQGVFFRTELGF